MPYRPGPSSLVPLRLARPPAKAAACLAEWDGDMTGTGRARQCIDCGRHVFDVAGLTPEDAASLCRGTEGAVPDRVFLRADGKVLTSDCPAGVRYARRQRFVSIGKALMPGGLLMVLVSGSQVSERGWPSLRGAPVVVTRWPARSVPALAPSQPHDAPLGCKCSRHDLGCDCPMTPTYGAP
jgi:hypothetical protein